MGLAAPSPAVMGQVGLFSGAVPDPRSHSQILPSASQSCQPKEENPSVVFHNWQSRSVGTCLLTVCAHVITFGGVTWGPCCLILVFSGTYMSCKQEVVCVGPSSVLSVLSLLLSCLETYAVLCRFNFLSVHYLLDFFAILGMSL